MDKKAALLILDGLLMTRTRSGPDAIGSGPSPEFCQPLSGPLIEQPQQEETPAELPGRYGVLDLETKRSAAEVGGWHRAERMGVSVAVLYDSGQDRYCTYLEQDIPALLDHLKEFDLLVGFNIKRFDNRVLSAYTSFDLTTLPLLDILEEITTRLGYRLSLDRLAEHTLGEKKSANGLQALQWYKQGRIEDIVAYCRKDVEITRGLFLFGARTGYLLFSNKAGKVVRLPVHFSW